MLENRFYKVGQSGGTYVTALLYNPITGESMSKCVRDYDDEDGSRDNDALYDMPIDEQARTAYMHSIGEIVAGDIVEVYKGRKIPIGTRAKVAYIKPWRDIYGRIQTIYAYFDDGRKTSTANCRLIVNGAAGD